MARQFVRLVGILWLSLFLAVFAVHIMGETLRIPLIAFLSVERVNPEIFLGDSESTLTLPMTENQWREDTLSWSPDGRYLMFDSYSVPDDKIWLLDTQDWTIKAISLGESSYVFWHSVNELRIGISRTDEEHLLNVQTLETSPYVKPLPCRDCSFNAPHGGMTPYELLLTERNGELEAELDTSRYFSGNFDPNVDYQIWSPDGESFLFITALQGQFDLYLSAAEGGTARRLTDTPNAEQMPSWSPDGQKISYVFYEDSKPEIYVMEIATGYRYKLSHEDGRNSNPIWQPVP